MEHTDLPIPDQATKTTTTLPPPTPAIQEAAFLNPEHAKYANLFPPDVLEFRRKLGMSADLDFLIKCKKNNEIELIESVNRNIPLHLDIELDPSQSAKEKLIAIYEASGLTDEIEELSHETAENYSTVLLASLKNYRGDLSRTGLDTAFNNLSYLKKKGDLTALANFIKHAWEIDDVSTSVLMDFHLESFFPTETNLKSMISLGGNPQMDKIAVMMSLFPDSFSRGHLLKFETLTLNFITLLEKAATMDSVDKLSILSNADNGRMLGVLENIDPGVFSVMVVDFPRTRMLNERVLKRLNDQLEKEMFYKDGTLDKNFFNLALDNNCLSLNIFYSIQSEFPPNEADLIDFSITNGHISGFIPSEEIKNSDLYFKDGNITSELVQRIMKLETDFENIRWRELLSDDVLNTFPEDERKFWIDVVAVEDSCARLLLKNKEKYEAYSNPENNNYTSEFFLDYIKESVKNNSLYTTSDLIDSLNGWLENSNEYKIFWKLVLNKFANKNDSEKLSAITSIEQIERVNKILSDPEINNFLGDFEHSGEYLFKLLTNEEIVSVNQIDFYTDILGIIFTNKLKSGFLDNVAICAEKLNKPVDEILTENLDFIISQMNGLYSYDRADILSDLQLSTDQLQTWMTRVDSIPTFLMTVEYLQGARDLGYEFLATIPVFDVFDQDKSRFLDALKKAGTIGNLLSDEKAILGLINNSTLDFGQYLTSFVDMEFREDSVDHERNGNINKKTARSRNESLSSIKTFEEKIEKLNTSDEYKKRVIEMRDNLTLILNNFGGTLEDLETKYPKLNSFLSDFDLESRMELALGDSAKAFEIYNKKLDKTRMIPAFNSLWQKKITDYFEENVILLSDPSQNNQLEEFTIDALNLYLEGLKMYQNVEGQIIPGLREMNKALEDKTTDTGVWFSGRDGIPLYLSLKASQFGADFEERSHFTDYFLEQATNNPVFAEKLFQIGLKSEELDSVPSEKRDDYVVKGLEIYLDSQARFFDFVKFAHISRLVLENTKNQEQKDALANYLLDLGITHEMLAIDTGYMGTVIKEAMNYVNREKVPKISLISSRDRSTAPELFHKYGLSNDSLAGAIESLPKAHHRTIAIVDGKPIRMKNTPDLQALNWVVNQAVIREFAPRPPKMDTLEASMPISIHDEIIDYAHKLGLDEDETVEISETVKELYEKAKENVAPIMVSFADKLLTDISISGDEKSKLLFAGRDALPIFEAAKILLEKFPDQYNGVTREKLIYAYLSRKLVDNADPQQISQYIQELGANIGDNLTLVDIGMYGTMLVALKRKMPNVNLINIEYLISRTHEANGYIDDGINKVLSVFTMIPGNPAVHFLEDTFSGLVKSPIMLTPNDDGLWEPNTVDSRYPANEELMRRFAIKAVEDYTRSLDTPSIDFQEARMRLNDFLSNEDNFKDIMVPHE